MNSNFFKYFGTLIFIFSIFYVIGILNHDYTTDHATLNESAIEPDMLLNNVRHYAKENGLERSLKHLDKAIYAIKNLELDSDENSQAKMEEAITMLDRVYNKLLKEGKVSEDMYEAFEFSLNILALSELRVSEKYAESNNIKMSEIALKYAKMHLKSAIKYAKHPNFETELHIFNEIDSLIAAGAIAPVLITEKIDHMISEMDTLIAREETQVVITD